MKKYIPTLVQLAIGISILSAIFFKLHGDGKLAEMKGALATCVGNGHFLLSALMSFALCLYVCSLRWQVLLHEQDLDLPFHRVHALYYVGHFFNAFLLGVAGGDVAKAIYVAKDTRHNRAEAVATVLIDRLVGLFTLVGLCAAMVLIRMDFFGQAPETRNAVLFTGALVLTALILLLAIFARPWLERTPRFKHLLQSTAPGRILDRIYCAMHTCLRKPSVVLITVVYSLINHIAQVAGGYFLGRALELKLTFADQLTVLPLINVIAIIPISPSGIGTRDAAMIYLYSAFSVAEASALTLSLMLYGILMFWSLVGGFVYLHVAARAGRARAAA